MDLWVPISEAYCMWRWLMSWCLHHTAPHWQPIGQDCRLEETTAFGGTVWQQGNANTTTAVFRCSTFVVSKELSPFVTVVEYFRWFQNIIAGQYFKIHQMIHTFREKTLCTMDFKGTNGGCAFTSSPLGFIQVHMATIEFSLEFSFSVVSALCFLLSVI